MLSAKKYTQVTGLIFLIVVVVHIFRLLNGWNVVLGDWTVPMWASYLGLLVGGFLAYNAFQHSK